MSWNPFAKSYTEEELKMFEFLSGSRLFSNLSRKELARFLPHLYQRSYIKDEVIFFRNDPSQAIYIIQKGTVSLKVDIGSRFETFAQVYAPATVGSNALLPKTRRLHTAVVASEACDLVVIPQVNILNIFEREVSIRYKMTEALARIYYDNSAGLLQSYRNTFGFFDLKDIANRITYGE
ncbi:cyclic nucleotide-binding domain-containing protein [Eisenibacter elegans]|jgi:CRP-like cAMP-binding protein|uniref:cyclic nucleotide-binding domain-containing protein n=1 Tax=Eisenibacter elegans TaxID=997 RepID=UPI000412DE0B|nr:cyclic nucleotide-binding domain-containing protein [Eisenibacter elegans]